MSKVQFELPAVEIIMLPDFFRNIFYYRLVDNQ
jgi:hypothetical protein